MNEHKKINLTLIYHKYFIILTNYEEDHGQMIKNFQSYDSLKE